MSEKDIKTKPQTTTKSVKNTPKSVEHSAKAAVKISVKVAQMVVAATKAVVSALVALGGWAVLLVALIIVIVVAAIAASPFGLFISVSAEGSKTTGTKRPFGLDCSGFVTWTFINSGFSANSIGHGTQGQIAKCSRIAWSNAQAGDLAFYGDLSHVGIIAGKDTIGNILVIHCSSSNNNVVITTNSGFGFAARSSAY